MRLPRFAIVASFLSLPVGCGGSGATSATDAGADTMTGAGTFQLAWEDNFDAFDFGHWALQTHTLGRQPRAVLDREHDLRERDRVAHADARADRHGQAVPRRRDALARHVDLRQGREPHPVREGIGRRVVAGADLHALAGRRLERARHRGPRPLRRSRADERHGLHRTTDDATGHDVGDADARRAGVDARLRSDGRLPRLRDRVDAGRRALHDRRRAEADLVDADRSAEAATEHPADDLGVGSADWAGPIQPDSAPTSADYDWIRVYNWLPDGTP